MSDDPRDALLAVAREIINKRGYMGLSVRTASAAAGVTEDVARRYYRNRDSLFAAAMRLPVDPVSAIPTLMAPGIEGMGERLVRFTLDTLRDPAARDDLLSLARTGVSAGHAVTGLQEFIEVGVVDRVAGMIGVPDARMRSALISSYLLGVATMRYGVRLEPLASASDEEVIRMVAPVIQDLLDPRHPIPGSSRARARASMPAAGPAQAGPEGSRRTFDPDPAATRAAEAARLAAEMARAAPPAPAAAPVRARTSEPRTAARTPASRASATSVSTAHPTAAPATAERATRKAPAAAPKADEKSPAAKRTAASKTTPKKATPKRAPAKKSAATRSPAGKAESSTPAKKAPPRRTTPKKAAPKKAATTHPHSDGAAAPTGPKHAQPSAEAAPSDSKRRSGTQSTAEPTR